MLNQGQLSITAFPRRAQSSKQLREATTYVKFKKIRRVRSSSCQDKGKRNSLILKASSGSLLPGDSRCLWNLSLNKVGLVFLPSRHLPASDQQFLFLCVCNIEKMMHEKGSVDTGDTMTSPPKLGVI